MKPFPRHVLSRRECIKGLLLAPTTVSLGAVGSCGAVLGNTVISVIAQSVVEEVVTNVIRRSGGKRFPKNWAVDYIISRLGKRFAYELIDNGIALWIGGAATKTSLNTYELIIKNDSQKEWRCGQFEVDLINNNTGVVEATHNPYSRSGVIGGMLIAPGSSYRATIPFSRHLSQGEKTLDISKKITCVGEPEGSGLFVV